MTQDEIIKMARQAGIVVTGEAVYKLCQLVAQHEREAIAQMIEDAPTLMDFAQNDQGGCLMCGFTPKLAAEYIRKGQA